MKNIGGTMADRDKLIKAVADKLGPEKLRTLVDQLEGALRNDPDVTPDAIQELIKQLEFVIDNPDRYKEVVTKAIQAGALDAADVPPEFDPIFITTLYLSLIHI